MTEARSALVTWVGGRRLRGCHFGNAIDVTVVDYRPVD